MAALKPVTVEPYSVEVDFEADIGSTFLYQFVWKTVQDPDDPWNPLNPPLGVDLTDCTALMQIKNSSESSEVQLEPTVVLEPDAVKGAIAIQIQPAQLAGLLPRKKMFYTLTITFPTGYIRKFAKGKFTLVT